MSMHRKDDPKFVRAYVRGMLRSAFVSLFWAIISVRKKRTGLTLQVLAKYIGVNKAELSRWFNGDPNWTVNTIGGLAHALDVDIRIYAIDRKTGEVYTPAGLQLSGAAEIGIPVVQMKDRTETTPPERTASKTLSIGGHWRPTETSAQAA